VTGFDLPRRATYENPVTEEFVNDRLTFLDNTAKFRRISLFWCLTIEAPIYEYFSQAPARERE
jgi:type IV secretion system protein VirB4